jgi:hypothetical protein
VAWPAPRGCMRAMPVAHSLQRRMAPALRGAAGGSSATPLARGRQVGAGGRHHTMQHRARPRRASRRQCVHSRHPGNPCSAPPATTRRWRARCAAAAAAPRRLLLGVQGCCCSAGSCCVRARVELREQCTHSGRQHATSEGGSSTGGRGRAAPPTTTLDAYGNPMRRRHAPDNGQVANSAQ